MSTLLVWKELLQKNYAKYTRYIDMALRFVLALFVFGIISHSIGYMDKLASIPVTIIICVLCAVLPITFTVFAATAVILLHMYSLALPVFIVIAIVFLLMYILYFRFTPSKSWIVLLTPVAFALNIPFAIPVAYGLLGTPVCALPAAFGTIIYYMLNNVKMTSSMYTGDDAMLLTEGIVTFIKQTVSSKEMLIMIAAMCVSLFIVYTVRNRSIDRSWEIATVSGAVSAMLIGTAGNMILNLHLSYGLMILSTVAALVAGFILEIMFFSMDYTKTEYVQFEDDEYYYYVKAIPKTGVSAPKKMVKHITERKEVEEPKKEEVKAPEEDMFATKCLTKELGLNMNNTDEK